MVKLLTKYLFIKERPNIKGKRNYQPDLQNGLTGVNICFISSVWCDK